MRFASTPVTVALSFLVIAAWGCSDRQIARRRQADRGPTIGAEPPEIAAAEWLNTDSPPTLASLRGQVVMVEFWATWCGPCVAGIPHLNELQSKYRNAGLRIISLTDDDLATVEGFQKGRKSPIEYTVGTGSDLGATYGVSSIPHAFVIGRSGKLLWEGHPADPDCEEKIEAGLEEK